MPHRSRHESRDTRALEAKVATSLHVSIASILRTLTKLSDLQALPHPHSRPREHDSHIISRRDVQHLTKVLCRHPAILILTFGYPGTEGTA